MTKRSVLYPIWGILFALCAGLGFIPAPTGALKVLLTLASLAFFVPAGCIMYQASKTGHRDSFLLLLVLSVTSLGLTLVLLVLNLLSVMWPAWIGRGLYILLVMVSSPMICSGYWALSLFLWACIMMMCVTQLWPRKK